LRERRANDYQGGGVYQQSLASEMEAVTSRYESEVRGNQERLERLRADLRSLDESQE
jgi:hypothetical protein